MRSTFDYSAPQGVPASAGGTVSTVSQRLCECGAELTSPVPAGLCPKCLLGAGMELLGSDPLPQTSSTSAKTGMPRQFGGYELLEEIARGGMGVVYRARQISLDRVVAVKMLLFGNFASDEFVRRFKAEASAAAVLQHPNIVAIHEIGEHEGQHYFSMEFVEGRNLADVVRERPLSGADAAAHLQVLARAVHYAHQRGVLHRDLKPSNVLIDSAGQVRLTDFGLAKRFGDAADLSHTGQFVGTPNYMPPEQAATDRGVVGPASDVYSLGAILYHLLTGRPPVVADWLEGTLLAVLRDEPISPRLLNRSVPRDLETICLKCLEKNPLRRYQSAEELAEDLRRFLKREPIRARPASAVEKVFRWCRRKPALASAVALLTLLTAGSIYAANHLSRLHRAARWDSYVSEMSRAQSEWQQRRFADAFFYLQRQIPRSGERDLRGFEWRRLWSAMSGSGLTRLPVHADVVNWLGFSPDGTTLATFGWDARPALQVWDAQHRRVLWNLPDAASVGGFTADGRWLLAGRSDQTMAAYDPRTGKPLKVFFNAGSIVAFAPQAKRVVTMNAQRVLKVYELSSGRVVMELTNAARRFFDVGRNAPVAISPDGAWIAIVRAGDPSHTRDRGIELWSIASGTVHAFLPRAQQIRLIQFSPGSKSLAAGDGNGEIALWDWAASKTRLIQAHALPVQALAFSPDGETLASGASDETIVLWDVATLAKKRGRFEGQMGTVWSLAFSSDRKLLASGSRDMPINLWDLTSVPTRPAITNLNSDEVGNFVFSPDSTLMAGGCKDHQVRIWDTRTMEEKFRLRGMGYAVAFSGDGKRLLAGDEAGTAYWWDFARDIRERVPGYDALGQITCAEFSPDRRVAALGHKSGRIELVAIDNGRVIGSYEGHRDAVLSLHFTPDGKRFASGARDKEIRLWNVNDPSRSERVCAEHKAGVAGLAISSDGKRMVSGCNANTIKFWDLQHLDRSLGARTWHRSAIRSLAFSSDGERVASGSDDHSVKLWDFVTRRELVDYQFDAPIRMVTFSPDCNYLGVVTDKGSLHLLRAATLSEADQEIASVYTRR